MKRLVSIILAMVFAFSFVTANAEVPKFLTETYTNYTGEYSLSLSFESSDDIIALLEEMEMPDEVNNFVDLKTLLKSLLSYDAKMLLQADMSDDFKKIDLGLTADTLYKVDINKNLNVAADMKMGMWMKIDLNAENPVFEVVYSHPMLNKYMKINVFEMAADEAEKAEILRVLNGIFNKEYITAIQETSVSLLEQYADIKMSGAACTVKIDNEGFTAMLDELVPVIADMTSKMMMAAEPGYTDEVYMDETFGGIPSFAGLKILGDGGMTCKYSLLSGKISKAEMSVDLDIDISDLFTCFTGEEWEYESKGNLAFEMGATIKVSNLGRTKVNFPVLTDENSFDIMEMMPETHGPEGEEHEKQYPNFYAGDSVDYLPVVDGEIYVPVRTTFISAYDDRVKIEYNNGIITLHSSYFPGFTQLKLVVGSEIAYADAKEYKTGKVLEKNGVSYVSYKLIEDVFGWTLSSAYYDMVNKTYDYYFYTMN